MSTEIDPKLVINQLLQRIASLEFEKAMLAAQIEGEADVSTEDTQS